MDEPPPISWSGEDDSNAAQQQSWIREQEVLKSRLILEDDCIWDLSTRIGNEAGEASSTCSAGSKNPLRYIGGVDLSFSKSDPSLALGALVVLDSVSLQVVYEDFDLVQLDMPYIPGFLAFRECPVLVGLLQKMAASEHNALYPQVRTAGFGLASHLGVLVDMPTIGVGKNLHHVDSLTDEKVRVQAAEQNLAAGDAIPLIGQSGQVWGLALKSHESSSKPIFVSMGHRISLHTAAAIVRSCCRYRVPEPVRQADIRSREQLRLMEQRAN